MKSATRKLLFAGLAGVSILSATAVIAGGPGCGGYGPAYGAGYGPGPGYGPGMMGHGPGWGGPRHAGFAPEERAGWQLDVLKTSLKLQPAQENAWKTFAAAVQAQAKSMGQARDEMWDKARTMPERAELANRLVKERDQGMDKVTQALKAFYEVLTPEQRRVLDRQGPWLHG
jgi:hypothetical protein